MKEEQYILETIGNIGVGLAGYLVYLRRKIKNLKSSF